MRSSTPASVISTATSPRSSRRTPEAEAAGCDLAVFPSSPITGYPPEDLAPETGVRRRQPGGARGGGGAHRALRRRSSASSTPAATCYNAAAVCADGRVVGIYHKRLLPNYAVFDEQRYFAPGTRPLTLYEIAGVQVGVSICEDAWSPAGPIADAGRRRRRARRQPQRARPTPRAAGRAGAMLADPRRRRLAAARLRQPGRRPGRAGLRRRLAGVRRRRRALARRAAVRRGRC